MLWNDYVIFAGIELLVPPISENPRGPDQQPFSHRSYW